MADTGGPDYGSQNNNYQKLSQRDSKANPENQTDAVELKQTLGLFTAVAMILGTIVGSGIFVSPKGVLMESGSVGASIIIWTLSGIICLLGAVSFAELGTCIRKSGGMYIYIYEAFGDFPAFLFLWASLIIIFPAANAVIALTCAHYILYPFFPDCESPDDAVRLLAAIAITILTFINCLSVRVAAMVQNVFTVIKVLALVVIIITGVVVLCKGDMDNFSNAFENTNANPGQISLAFYAGLFSYSGWYTLNFLTEELKNPYQNLPRAIWIAMPLVTAIYVLANVAYFAVLTPKEIIDSEAVAVTFAERMFGVMSWLMPIMVAFSTFGSLNGCIMSVARVFFVGARQGHMPQMLAYININRFTPMPAVMFEGLASTMMLVTSDVFLLIGYVTLMEALAFLACIGALFYFRWKYPDMKRPIKVNLAVPIVFFIVCVFLVILPIVRSPKEMFTGIGIVLTGIPVYVLGVMWKKKPKSYFKYMESINGVVQKLCMGMPQEVAVD